MARSKPPVPPATARSSPLKFQCQTQPTVTHQPTTQPTKTGSQMAKSLQVKIFVMHEHIVACYRHNILVAGGAICRAGGEAGFGVEAVQITESLKPDVLLLDLAMARMHGLEVIRRIRSST